MFFLSMFVELTSHGNSPSSMLQLSIFAHAAVMNLISSVDSELGRELHNCQRHKPVSLSVVDASTSMIGLRVAFMGDSGLHAAEALVTALSRAGLVQLGSTKWHVEGIHCSGCLWGATCTWADLTEACNGSWLEFIFVTPTAVTKSDGAGGRFFNVLPEPTDVFGCLLDRWNDLRGPRLPGNLVAYIRSGGCVVTDVNIRCTTTQLKERTQKGVVGRVTYQLSDRDPLCISAMHQLGRLAFFSGVGYQTARGMGTVRTRSW